MNEQTLRLTKASDVQAQPVDWLWPGYLPRGMLTTLTGRPGVGKTTIWCSLVAAVTNPEQTFPDGTKVKVPGVALVLTEEDSMSRTLVPRLKAAGADLDRVFFVDGIVHADGKPAPYDPSLRCRLLMEKIRATQGVSLVVIDPILSVVNGDTNNAKDVRNALEPMANLAEETGFALLGIAHNRKSGTRGSTHVDALDSMAGSHAFGALARVVLNCEASETPGGGIMVRTKSNVSESRDGFLFRLQQHEVESSVNAQRVHWGELVHGSANELLARHGDSTRRGRRPEAINEAKDFLMEFLAGGAKSTAEIEREAEKRGITDATLRRAKEALGCTSKRRGGRNGRYFTALPKNAQPTAEEKMPATVH